MQNPLKEYTVTGNPVSFTTNVAKNLKQLKIPFTPIQSGSGDPSPDNVRPITGWTGVNATRCGKNLFNVLTIKDGYIDANGDWVEQLGYERITKNVAKNYAVTVTIPSGIKYVKISYNSEQDTNVQVILGSTPDYPAEPYTGTIIPVTFPAQGKNKCPTANGEGMRSWVLPSGATSRQITIEGLPANGNVTLSCNITQTTGTDSARRFYAIGSTSDFINTGVAGTGQKVTVKATADGTVVLKHNNVGLQDVYGYIENIQLEEGSSATAYEPYTNTVYGGELDLLTGVLTVTHKAVVYDGVNKTLNGGIYNTTKGIFGGVDTHFEGWNTGSLGNFISNKLKALVPNSSSDVPCFDVPINNVVLNLYIGSIADYPEITSKDDAKSFANTWLQENPVTIVGKLYSPLTYQLTPSQITTLIGTNTIWSDTNDSNTVKYLKRG